MDKTKQYYIAGPMTGYPKFNIPLFQRAAKELRDHGLKITSPVELDSQKVRDAGLASETGELIDGKIAGETWGEILARDVHIIADQVDGIIVLPGWYKSRGARLEVFVAMLSSKPVYDATHVEGAFPAEFVEIPKSMLLVQIVQGFNQ